MLENQPNSCPASPEPVTLQDIQVTFNPPPQPAETFTPDVLAPPPGPDHAAFFAAVRKSLLFGASITQDQVEGCEAVLAACAGWKTSWIAYALATTYHETAHTMKPIKEYGGTAYFMRMYDVTGSRPALARANGNTTPGDGAKYYGRGNVQLTWKNNYIRAGNKLGVNLVDDPDRALEKDIAAKILRYGMEEGWFTGKSLSTYLPNNLGSRTQFIECRRIINGVDKAEAIADEAVCFQNALEEGGWNA